MKLDEIDLLKIGDTIQMAGAIYAGEGCIYLCWFPEESNTETESYLPVKHDVDSSMQDLCMGTADWTKFLSQTDLMETEVLTLDPNGKVVKAIIRKSQRVVDQWVAWEVYRRDNYACRWCGNNKAPLTVDHLRRWEEFGPTIPANLVASCKKCNKTRGRMSLQEWLVSKEYFQINKKLTHNQMQDNANLVNGLDQIPLQKNIRSR